MTDSDQAARPTPDQSSDETFQIPIEVAELYEAKFVPALFAEWAPRLTERRGREARATRCLDVACGTGIVARTAAEIVGSGGRVVGVDLNEAMLAVASRVRPDIEWRQGDVAAAPVRGRGVRRSALPDGPDVLP